MRKNTALCVCILVHTHKSVACEEKSPRSLKRGISQREWQPPRCGGRTPLGRVHSRCVQTDNYYSISSIAWKISFTSPYLHIHPHPPLCQLRFRFCPFVPALPFYFLSFLSYFLPACVCLFCLCSSIGARHATLQSISTVQYRGLWIRTCHQYMPEFSVHLEVSIHVVFRTPQSHSWKFHYGAYTKLYSTVYHSEKTKKAGQVNDIER